MLINDGDTVCIVGGGPGGSACAMALLSEARRVGRKIDVVLFEHKKFSEHRHYNQCIGVLSPPFEDILKNELGLVLPDHLVLNDMEGYRLHSDLLSLDLIDEFNNINHYSNIIEYFVFHYCFTIMFPYLNNNLA